MKKIILLSVYLFITSLLLNAQSINSNWKYLRPSNTGIGGEVQLFVEKDDCGDIWTGGYLPFFSEGSVVKFNDTTWTTWSNIDGYIPNARVYDVAFDNNGGLWVACNANMNFNEHGGISHYDGTTWTTWNSANSPIPDDYFRGIAVDNNNNVWATFSNVQTSSGGVAKFDGTNWTIYTPSNSGLQSSEVDRIDVDAQNNIWIGTNLGLVKFDGLNWIMFTTQNSGLSNNNVTDVEYDAATNKIYAATGIAIDIFDGTTWSKINATNSPVSTTGLWAVDARNDSIIITTIGGSYLTYIYDGTNWITHPEMNHTYDARIDDDGNFWICGIGFLEKYDGANWTTYSVTNTGLPSMFNNEVFVDSKNRSWFGSSANGGISVFDCPNWESYNPYNYNLFPMPINYTGNGTGITEDSFGDVWMVFAGVAGGTVQIPNGDITNPAAWTVWENANSGVSLQFMNRAAADKTGNVWFGYNGACSVTRYSHATNSWTNFNLYQLGQITCGAGSGITSIRVDDSNNVWICGLAGLAKFDQNNWTFYSYLNTPMQQGFVNDIAFDTLGNKWITTEHGLYKFDGANWTKYDNTNTPMFGENCGAILVDNAGTIWVAAGDPVFPPYPHGLFSFDGTSWATYTTTNSGLPEKYVNRLALDTLGNIMVLTQGKGAAIFNPNGVVGYECIDKSLPICVTTSVSENDIHTESTAIVYPNPFVTSTTIEFALTEAKETSVTVFDVMGKEVRTVPTKNIKTGKNKITVDLSELNAGIYFCKVKSHDNFQTIKLIKN